MRTLIASLIVLFAAPALLADSRPEPRVVGEIDGDAVYQVLPPDAIPAIREPRFLRGEAADAQMHPDEPVMGVVIEGQARAYSLWQLDAHEIVNDAMKGAAFAPTW